MSAGLKVTATKWAPGIIAPLKNLLSGRGGRAALGAGVGGLAGAAHGVGAGDDASGILAKTLAGAGGLAALGGAGNLKQLPYIAGGLGAAGLGALGHKAYADSGLGQPVEDKRKFFS